MGMRVDIVLKNKTFLSVAIRESALNSNIFRNRYNKQILFNNTK